MPENLELPADIRDALSATSSLVNKQPLRAARNAREILLQHPHAYEARLVLARALRAQGNLAGALQALELLVAAEPPVALACLVQALVLIDQGEGARAIECLKRAAALDPLLPGVWLTLAEQRLTMGDQAGAWAAYGEHVRVSANAPHICEALAAIHEHNLERAERTLRAHLAGWPNDVAAMVLLGEVLGRAGSEIDAATLFERALTLYPDFTVARQNYAMVLCQLQRIPEALAQLDRLFGQDPDNPVYRIQYADSLAMLGDFDGAIRAYYSVVESSAKDLRYWIGFGNTLKSAGRQGEAIAA